MSLTAVVLDLDGTLFDHATASRTGLRGWLGSLGRRSTPDLEAAWAAAEERHFRSWREGGISFAEQRRRRLRDVLPLLGLPVGDDADLDLLFAQGFLRAYERAWVAFDDVPAGLDALRAAGLRTAVLTNGTRRQQNAKIDAIGLTDRLGPVFTAEELGRGPASPPCPSWPPTSVSARGPGWTPGADRSPVRHGRPGRAGRGCAMMPGRSCPAHCGPGREEVGRSCRRGARPWAPAGRSPSPSPPSPPSP